MGSRAQILIKDEGVYLYSHWGSETIEQELRGWLDKGKSRWNDPEYLARIIFSQMVKKYIDGDTGFGIGTSKHGDLDILITVDCERRTVAVENCFTGNVMSKSFVDFIGR